MPDATPAPATVPAHSLRVGDVVMPPAREVSLWMARSAAEKALPLSGLGITLEDVHEGEPDKRGRWLWFSGYLCDAWYGDGNRHPFKFKARPDTKWAVVSLGGAS